MAVICNNCGVDNFDLDTICVSCGADLYYRDALPLGTVLEKRYIIEKLIKVGGMGAVYMGLDERLSRYCAIKEMLTTYETIEEKNYAERRFKVEARMLSQFDHPNLPAVYDYFIEKGHYYLVMSFVDGIDFNELLYSEGKPGLPEEKVIDWSIEILDLLDYLHNQHPPVVYRDLKPGNIMLHRDGRVMLIDFGIARTIQPEAEGVKYTAIGTDGYSPEEQYRGQVEPRSDLYSLGATMYHLLTGKRPPPFNPGPLRNVAPWISPVMEKIVMKALEYRAEDRFSSAKEMQDALLKIHYLSPDEKNIMDMEKSKEEGNTGELSKKRPVSYKEMMEILGERESGEYYEDRGISSAPVPAGDTKSSSLRDKGKDDIISFRKSKVENFLLDKTRSSPEKDDTHSLEKTGRKAVILPGKSHPVEAKTNILPEEIVAENVGGALNKFLENKVTDDENKVIPEIYRLASMKKENKSKKTRKNSEW